MLDHTLPIATTATMPLAVISHHHHTKYSDHTLSREATTTMPLAATPPHHHTKYVGHTLITKANTVRPPVAILHQCHAMYGNKLSHTLPIVTKETRILASILHHHDTSHGEKTY